MLVCFDQVAGIYDETRGFPVLVMDKIVKTLMKEVEGYVSVLDVGVGTARFSKSLQDLGHCVAGVDVSSGMLRKAVERGMRNLLLGSVCSLPFEDGSFDVALSTGLLHLVEEWRSVLREVSRVTRELLVSVVHRGKVPVREEYVNLLVKYGWELSQLEIAERELEAEVKPARSVDVATYEASTARSLAFLQQKAFSYQWGHP